MYMETSQKRTLQQSQKFAKQGGSPHALSFNALLSKSVRSMSLT